MGRVSQHSGVARGHALRRLNAHMEKVKELLFDYVEWEEWELEDDYPVIEGKFEGRRQWDHKNLLDTDDGDKIVVV